ncbi:MAG: metallophosphoesterase family protein [Candidatus Heimdallarchaeota archaeon]
MQYGSVKIWRVLRRGGRLFLFFMLGLVLVFEVYTFAVSYIEGNTALPAAFGNFERVRELLASDEQRDEFSFAVVGDTRRGPGTFEQIWQKLKDEPLSFMVLLGDCVREGTAGYHRFFRSEWAGKAALPFPVFYVAGNHDVDRETFPISQFEKIYGPTNFSFGYHGSLFIVLRILNKPYSTKESLAFLESLLSARRHDYRKVFVFMHIPPYVSSDFFARRFEDEKRLVALFDRFHVDYVIAGDYHGYARVKLRNTVYLVSGGGGSHLEEQKFGRFHHAIVIKVRPNSVSERILQVNKKGDFEDRAKELALAEVYPWMEKNWPVAILLNVGILGILFWAFRGFLRHCRTSRSD